LQRRRVSAGSGAPVPALAFEFALEREANRVVGLALLYLAGHGDADLRP
jgi:hypothetical protein